MPPKKKVARPGARRPQHKHCFIWAGKDGKVKIVCAHCPQVYASLDLSQTYTEEELRRAVRGSQAGHAHICSLPIN
jgi:hypothetical protein